MKRTVVMAIAAFLVSVLTAVPAAPAQTTKLANDCEARVTQASATLQASALELFRGCFERVQLCYDGLDRGIPQAGVDRCVDRNFRPRRKCSDGKLGETNPGTQILAGAESEFLARVDKKCNPTVLGVPASTILGAASGPLDGMFEKAAAGTTMKVECESMNPPFLNVDTNYANWRACLLKRVIMQSTRQLTTGFHFGWRWWAAWRKLVERGRTIVIDPFPIGMLNVSADTQARLNTAVFPADITGITASYTLEIGGVDAATGVAPINQPASSFLATPVTVGAFGLVVCVKQPLDGQGKVCCLPGGCPTLGPKDYAANIDHDSSGLNTAFGFLPGAVDPLPDPGCSHVAANSIAGLPAVVTLPCKEAHAQPGACNVSTIGSENPNAHAPRCSGGARNGLFCDPTSPLASECPAGGLSCASRSPAFPGASLANPCNSATRLTAAGAGFTDGDMVIATSIQFTLHEVTIDNIINATGVAGMDGIPDGFGVDGIPCTSDDTTPPQDAAQLSLTTGTASATVFNSNMVPSIACPANPGEIRSSDAGGPPFPPCAGAPSVGETPTDACANLSLGSAPGYELVGAFPALDGSTTGDTATSIRESFQ